MASHRRQAISASCVWQARRAPAEGRTRRQASPRFHQVLDPRLQMGGCRSPNVAIVALNLTSTKSAVECKVEQKPWMSKKTDTAVVFIDPQNDVLSEKGANWGAV